MKRTFVLAIALLKLSGAYAAGPTDRVLSASEFLSRYSDDGDRITLELFKIPPEFVIEVPQGGQTANILAALEDAKTTLRSVVVRYSLDSANLSSDGSIPAFRVVGLVYEGREIPLPSPVENGSASKPLNATQRAWARGVGLVVGHQYNDAIPELDRVLADPAANSEVQLQSHKLRGEALAAQAHGDTQAVTEAADRKLIRALEDYRQWQLLAPNEVEPLYEIAYTLRNLGAYPEAFEIYAELTHSWPKEWYWTALRTADTYRESGDPLRTLATLDGVLKEHGRQRGMAFHFHRGWALLDVGRSAEAVEELSTGLADQPGYAWAFVYRACAESQMGRLEDAVRDQRTAVGLLAEGADDSASSRFNSQRAQEVESRLSAALQEHRSVSFSSVCRGYWNDGAGRQRSSLLPPHVSWIPIRRGPIRTFLAAYSLPMVSITMAALLLMGFNSWRKRIVRPG